MGLLDILAEKTNCTYLSDLRYLTRPNATLQRAVAEIQLDSFSAHEWLDAADYLCGVKCQSAEDARKAVLFF